MGASVVGFDGIFLKYLVFVRAVRKYQSFLQLVSPQEPPREAASPLIYGAVIDISKCFDTIKREKMLDIISNTLLEASDLRVVVELILPFMLLCSGPLLHRAVQHDRFSPRKTLLEPKAFGWSFSGLLFTLCSVFHFLFSAR
jgi:hypothetical protein